MNTLVFLYAHPFIISFSLVLAGSFHILAQNADTACYEINRKDTLYKMTCNSMEQMPEFKGGMDSLLKFINKTVRYPKLAQQMEVWGKVFVGFVVEKDGQVSNVELLKGIKKQGKKNFDDAADQVNEEALRVMRMLPAFAKPGLQRGKPVRVKYVIPLNFTIR